MTAKKPKGSKGIVPIAASSVRAVGRPKIGKRSDPSFKQVSAWIRKDTHERVTRKLFLNGRQEFSGLIQTLLEGWLKQAS